MPNWCSTLGMRSMGKIDPHSSIFQKFFQDRGFEEFCLSTDGIVCLSLTSGRKCVFEDSGNFFNVTTFDDSGRPISSSPISSLEELEPRLLAAVMPQTSTEPDESSRPCTRVSDGPVRKTVETVVRLKQATYRTDLVRLWGGSCPMSGETFLPLLRASHAKPFADCNDQEAIDPYNGVLLRVDFDSLFDAGWISFTPQGEILLSTHLPESVAASMNLREKRLPEQPAQANPYLDWHRTYVFKP